MSVNFLYTKKRVVAVVSGVIFIVKEDGGWILSLFTLHVGTGCTPSLDEVKATLGKDTVPTMKCLSKSVECG